MKNKQKKNKILLTTTIIATLSMVIFLLMSFLIIESRENKELTLDKEYYKEAMIKFCEVAKSQNEIMANAIGEEPIMTEETCKSFILSWDEEE